jgi:DNA-3-methyladenine glycosylase II
MLHHDETSNSVNSTGPVARHEIRTVAPFRLDLTVSAFRRLSTNVVDLFAPDGQYIRALAGGPEPVVVRARQIPDSSSLSVSVEGAPGSVPDALAMVRRMLGVDRDLVPFDRAAATIPWLAPLARRMRGVKPPRYPSLWEGCANSIVFQQVSLRAASTIMQRLIVALGKSVAVPDVPAPLYAFPDAASFANTPDADLRDMGLSGAKIATLRRVGESLASGTLDEAMLEERSSADAAALLCRIKGIGPWTAAVVLLRGLGRLDVFPANDSSIRSNLALVAGEAELDPRAVLDTLGAQRGMLYFYLLLARLEARDQIGRPSFDAPSNVAASNVAASNVAASNVAASNTSGGGITGD